MNRRLEKFASGVLAPMNPYVSVVLGLLTFVWGLWVLLPFWDVFTRADVYIKALEFAPEWAWGAWATTTGASILVGIYYAHARPLALALGAVTWHWFTVAGMLWWGDWQNTAGLTYTFIGVYSVLAYLNVRVNYVKQGISHI